MKRSGGAAKRALVSILALAGLLGCASGERDRAEKPSPPLPLPVLDDADLERAGRLAGEALAAAVSASPSLPRVAFRERLRTGLAWPALARSVREEVVWRAFEEASGLRLTPVELATSASWVVAAQVTALIRPYSPLSSGTPSRGADTAIDYAFAFALVPAGVGAAGSPDDDVRGDPLVTTPCAVPWATVVPLTKEGGRRDGEAFLPRQPLGGDDLERLAESAAREVKRWLADMHESKARLLPLPAARERLGVQPGFHDRLLDRLVREGVVLGRGSDLPTIEASVGFESGEGALGPETHRFHVTLSNPGAHVARDHFDRALTRNGVGP